MIRRNCIHALFPGFAKKVVEERHESSDVLLSISNKFCWLLPTSRVDRLAA
jgi:hypothetical protein